MLYGSSYRKSHGLLRNTPNPGERNDYAPVTKYFIGRCNGCGTATASYPTVTQHEGLMLQPPALMARLRAGQSTFLYLLYIPEPNVIRSPLHIRIEPSPLNYLIYLSTTTHRRHPAHKTTMADIMGYREQIMGACTCIPPRYAVIGA